MRSLFAIAALVVALAGCIAAYDVGAIYFGDWHLDPFNQKRHGMSWTEWELVVNALPRWAGHVQPNLPYSAPGWGPLYPEDDPKNMQVSQRRRFCWWWERLVVGE